MLDLCRSEVVSHVGVIEGSLKLLQDKVEALKLKTEGQEYRERSEVKKEHIEAKQLLEDNHAEFKKNSDLLGRLQDDRQKVLEYRNYAEKRDSYSKEMSNLELNATNVRVRIESKQAEIAASKRLKEKRDYAASASIEAKTEEINDFASKHVDSLFSEDGTYFKINSFSKTTKGEERSTFSLDIFHKGCKVKKLKELSGGERSRAILAFQLGLSDIYDSPILMIDEGFKGLGVSDRAKCMEVISEVASRKLVIVVEHNIEDSSFDEVIEL